MFLSSQCPADAWKFLEMTGNRAGFLFLSAAARTISLERTVLFAGDLVSLLFESSIKISFFQKFVVRNAAEKSPIVREGQKHWSRQLSEPFSCD